MFGFYILYLDVCIYVIDILYVGDNTVNLKITILYANYYVFYYYILYIVFLLYYVCILKLH